jgi:alanine racemase
VHPRHAWVEIDTAAIARNVRTLTVLTPPRTGFMAVVKADGYGHGAVAAALAALASGADRLGVATVEEAVALRGSGIDAPLHLLAEPPTEAASAIVEHGLIPAVTTRGFAEALGRAAVAAGREVVYHMKLDTGMNRIGFPAEAAATTAAALAGIQGVRLEGVFTHFATADVPGDWEFSRQVERFALALEDLRDNGVRPVLVHAANSAATVLHPETHHDLVRCGIAVYGLHPSEATRGHVDLEPAMTVKARVSLVKRVGLGDGVSYGFIWHAAGPTTIATVPVGYADGVHRVLSSNMDVLIGGRRCRQVGRICMDQFMVEVPPGVDVREGAEVVIVGVQGGERITMDELATAAGTINYELACGFALRMERRVV